MNNKVRIMSHIPKVGMTYKHTLRALQIKRVALQKDFIQRWLKALVSFDEHGAVGKGGIIKWEMQYLSLRELWVTCPVHHVLATMMDKDVIYQVAHAQTSNGKLHL